MTSPKSNFAEVDKYINSFPEETQTILKKIRKMIADIIPQADQVISYGVPTFKINGKYVIYFAGYKNHISLYPASDELVENVKDAEKYRVSKGTLKFKLSEPIPYDLIEKVVKFKVKERSENQGYSKKK
jgi:uncharacterized protein YdhG (YjbR/CyaY superfamily)